MRKILQWMVEGLAEGLWLWASALVGYPVA